MDETSRRISALASFTLLAIIFQPCFAADWPHWRGPNRNDVVGESSGWNGKQWPLGDVIWQGSFGKGCTSPIIVDSKLYTLGWRSNKDTLYCLDAATGKEIWQKSYTCPEYGRFSTGDKGIYAGISSTPEYDPQTGYLYTLSIDGDLNCWNSKENGKNIWKLNLYDQFKVKQRPDVGRNTHRDYGYTISPLVHKDSLIVEVGGDAGNLIALDKRTGKQLWASQCKDEPGHSGAPVPITVEGIPCAAILTLRKIVIVRLDKGHEGQTVATYPWTTDFANNIPTPAVHKNNLIVTTAYNRYAVCRVQITLKGAKKVWEKEGLASGVCSLIIHKGNVYWAWRGVHCLDFETGKERWLGGKVGTAGSGIVTSDDRMIVWSDRGDLQLVETAVRSADKFKVLAEKKGVFSADAWPHVVLSNGRLYCKDRNGNLKCFPVAANTVKALASASPSPRPAAMKVDLKSWPGDDPHVLLAWQKEFGAQKLVGTLADGKVALKPRESGRIDANGIQLANGAVLVDGADETLLNQCKKSGELSLEAIITSSSDRQSGPARIVSFSSDGYSRNFSLAQESNQLLLRLRTPQTGENGIKPETKLCSIEAGRSYHLIVTYRDGQLVCYLNGRKVKETSDVRGNFSNWASHHFLLGDEWDGGGTRDWSGDIERFAILCRFIGDEEAAMRFNLSGVR